MKQRSRLLPAAVRAAVLMMLVFLAGAPTGFAQTPDDAGIGFGASAAAAPQALLSAAPPASGAGVFVKHAMEFVPYFPTSTFNHNIGWVYNSGAGSANLDAFLTLPHQARINKVILYFYDSDPQNISGTLIFIPNNGQNGVIRGNFTTAGAPAGYGYVEVMGITNPIVDLTVGSLVVDIVMPPSANVRVGSVRVDYSYNALLPSVTR